MTKNIFISHAWGNDELNRDNHMRCKELCDKLINDEFISDLGIKGNIRRRFTKNQILEAINNKSYDR